MILINKCMQKSNEMMKENAKETNKQEETNTYKMSRNNVG